MKFLAGLLAAGIFLSGCATTRTVETTNPLNIEASLDRGDRVSLITTDRRHYEFRVAALSEEGIDGRLKGGSTVVIPYDQIEYLSVRVPRPARTAGAVVGGIVGGTVAVYAVAVGAAVAVLVGLSGGCCS